MVHPYITIEKNEIALYLLACISKMYFNFEYLVAEQYIPKDRSYIDSVTNAGGTINTSIT